MGFSVFPLFLPRKYTMAGIRMNGNVAKNLKNGPIPVGSKKNRMRLPPARHKKPDRQPNIKKHVIQMRLIGSNMAIPQPGIRGKIGVVKAETTADNAMKIPAPAISSVHFFLVGASTSLLIISLDMNLSTRN